MDKTKRYGRRRSRAWVDGARGIRSIALATAAVVSAWGSAGRASSLYWDIDGVTAGAGGTTPAGTWDASTSNWSSDSSGSSATALWSDGNTAIFAAGTNATGGYTVTVSGTRTIGGLTFEEGGLTLTGGTLAVNSAAILDVGPSLHAIIDSVISGSAGITKAGTGGMSLWRTNTYSGGTNVQGGILELAVNGAAGSGAINIGAPSGSASATVQIAVTGLNIPNAIVATAGSTGSAGIYSAHTSGASTFSGNITLMRNFTLSGDPGGTTVYSGVINDGAFTFGITKEGSHTVVLSGTNTYDGATTINAGTLRVGTNVIPITSAVTLASGATLELTSGISLGSLSGSGNVALGSVGMTIGAINTDSSFSGVISGGPGTSFQAFGKNGTGRLVLSGSNTFTGDVYLHDGTLEIPADSALGNGSNEVRFQTPATLSTTASFATARNIVLNAAGTVDVAASTALTFNGVVSGSSGLTKTGTGTLRIAGANTYSGVTTVGGGTLELNSSGSGNAMGGDLTINSGGTAKWLANSQLGANKNITLNSGGTFNLNGSLQTVNNFTVNGSGALAGGLLTVDGTYGVGGGFTVATDVLLNGNFAFTGASGIPTVSGNITLGGSSSTFNVNDGSAAQDLIVSGVISGNSSLVKTGGGLFQLSNNMTFGGAGRTITVTAGQLSVGADAAMGNSANTIILDGGTLRASSNFSTARAISIATSGGTVDVPLTRVMTLSGVLSGSSTLTKVGTGTLLLTSASPYAGPVTVSDGVLQAQSAAGMPGTITDNAGVLFTTNALSNTYVGSISGTGAVTLTPTVSANLNDVLITTAQTYTGATTLNTHSQISLSGTGGALASGSISMTRAGLRLINTTDNLSDRISNSASISMSGSHFTLTGSTSADTSETVGAMSVGIGASTVSLSSGGSSGNRLTAASFARSTGGVLLVRGSNLGTNNATGVAGNNLRFTSAPTLSGSGSVGTSTVGIIPGVFTDSAANNGGTVSAALVTYDTNGVRALTSSEYSNTFVADANVAPNAILANISSDLSINAIEYGGAGAVGSSIAARSFNIDSGNTLTIKSGMLYSNGNTPATIAGGTLAFGTGGTGEAIIVNYNNNSSGGGITINSAIHASSLTKSGSGVLTLGAGSNPTFTGTTYVDQGALLVTANNQLGSDVVLHASGLVSAGGTSNGYFAGSLQLSGNVSYSLPLQMHGGYSFAGGLIAQAALDNLSGNNTWSGNITLVGQQQNSGDLTYPSVGGATGTLVLSGQIATVSGASGSTGLNKVGHATVVLTGSLPNTYGGLTRPQEGTLIVEKDAAFGSTQNTTLQTANANSTVAFRAPASSPGGFNYATAEVIGTDGFGFGGAAQIQNLGGANTFAGSLALGGPTVFGLPTATTDIISGSLEISGPVGARVNTARAWNKGGSGDLILSNSNVSAPSGFFTMPSGSRLNISQGAVVLRSASAASGNLPSGFNVYVFNGGGLVLDNSLAVNTSRVSGLVRLAGGELKLVGKSGTALTQSFTGGNALNVRGHSIVTVVPSGQSTQLDLGGGFNRDNLGTLLIRGLGDSNAIVSSTVSLRGGGGSGGSATISILPTAIGDDLTSGNGTDFVTTVGGNFRRLASSEYTSIASAGIINVSTTGSDTLSSSKTINSLKMTGTNPSLTIASNQTLTLEAGAALVTGGTSATINGGTLNFNTAEGIFHVVAGNSLTVGSVIGSTNSVTKSGGGTMTLTGANTYATPGATTINAGVLEFSADNNLGDTSAPIELNGGTLRATSNVALSASRSVDLTTSGSSAIDTPTSVTLTMNGNLTGSGTLAKTGAGKLVLANAAPSFSGILSVGGGTLAAGADANLGTAATAIDMNGGILDLGAGTFAKAMTLRPSGGTVLVTGVTTYSGVISGGGNLIVAGSGTFNPIVTNTYYGKTIVNSGATLSYINSNGLSSIPGALETDNYILNGGTLNFTGQAAGGITTVNALHGITLAADSTIDLQQGTSGVTPYALAMPNPITGSAGFTKTGPGTLQFSGSGANTYTGTTVVSAGILQLNRSTFVTVPGNLVIDNGGTVQLQIANQIADTSAVTVNSGGTLSLSGGGDTIGSLAGAGTVSFSNNPLTVGGTNSSTAFSGTLTGGAITLTKNGTGTFTISGTQTYTTSAAITVNGGTLALNSAAGSKVASVNASGGNVTLGATEALTTLTVGAARTVAMDADGSRVLDVDTLSVAGSTDAWTAKVDLNDNSMIVRYSGSSPLTQLTNQVKTGLNLAGGYWDGNGITSTSAAGDVLHQHGLGVVEAGDVLDFTSSTTALFAGQTVDATTVLLKYALFGDTDLDGDIDGDDFFAFDEAVDNPSLTGWFHGDFNYDGDVDRDNDFAIMIDTYQNTLGAGPIPIEIQGVIDRVMSVPEPAGGALVIMGAGVLLQRKRRIGKGVAL